MSMVIFVDFKRKRKTAVAEVPTMWILVDGKPVLNPEWVASEYERTTRRKP